MKVAAISDLHGYLPSMKEPADILLIAGDISPLSIQFNKVAMKEWLSTEFSKWIKELPVEKVFLVAGNHDSWFQGALRANVHDVCNNNGKVTYLQNESTIYTDNDGNEWKIFGTPYCSIFGNWPFMREYEVLVKKFKEIPDDCDIIIAHDPPYEWGDCDCILEPTHRFKNKHCGTVALREAIKNIPFQLLVCGHIHSGDHTLTKGCVNVSYLNEYYKPAYPYFYTVLNKRIKVTKEYEIGEILKLSFEDEMLIGIVAENQDNYITLETLTGTVSFSKKASYIEIPTEEEKESLIKLLKSEKERLTNIINIYDGNRKV